MVLRGNVETRLRTVLAAGADGTGMIRAEAKGASARDAADTLLEDLLDQGAAQLLRR